MKRLDLLSSSGVTAILSLAILLSINVITSAEANDPEAPLQKMTEADIQSLRSQFMEEVREEQDIGKQKERLLDTYLELAAVIKDQQSLRGTYEAERTSLGLEPTNNRRSKSLQSDITELNDEIVAHEFIQDLAVRAYGLLQQLEQLEASVQAKTVTREEYHREKRFLLDRLAQVDYLRQQMRQTDAIVNKLEAISREVSQLQN